MTATASALAQSTVTISMEAAPARPRLRPPFVVGSRPTTPLVFAIPATGQAPLNFTATGMPAGLTLAADTGIISGTTPAAGSYPIVVTLKSGDSTATATYTLTAGDTLSLTPPTGWNSYDSFGASVTEQDMLDQATAVRKYLQPYGWNTVVIDYRWYEPGLPIDANGRYLPATSKYPSATGGTGFKALADKIHAMGLSFGIHIMRGVPRKSYDAKSPIADSNYTTADAGNPNDACPWDTHMWGVRGDTAAGQAWYDALFKQYASWGLDFVKIDDMLNNETKQFHQAEADAIRKAADKTGRSFVLSFSPGPDDPNWLPSSSANLNKNANMWRVVNDFWDFNGLTDLPGAFTEAAKWQGVSGLTPGHWPDLDMLPLGYLGPRNEWHASGQTTFSKNEQVTIMTLWSMLPSPLIYGGNPERLGNDAWTLALLANEEVMAVNQDALGARGVRKTITGGELWVRALSGGRKAFAFFNRGNNDVSMSATFADLGVTGAQVVRDLWKRADVTAPGDTITANVPGKAALLYSIAPPNAGGTGGTGGQSGTGGVGTSGSSAGGSGSGGSAGGASSGGAVSVGGASGGSVTTAGGVNAGGVASPTGGTSSNAAGSPSAGTDAGGCGCSFEKTTPVSLVASLLGGAAALGVALSRRRRRR
jgi:hypothetical protein